MRKVTDVLGLASEFRYGDGDFIDSLITPYGNTRFSEGESGTDRWVEALDALGQRERVEYNGAWGALPQIESQVPSGNISAVNNFLSFRNSFFWDKKAMENYSGNVLDHKNATIYHWLHTADFNKSGTILESEKAPLENRVWYNAYFG